MNTWLAWSQNGCLSHKMELIKLTTLSGAGSRAQAAPRTRWPCLSRGLEQMTSRGAFQSQTFCDSLQIITYLSHISVVSNIATPLFSFVFQGLWLLHEDFRWNSQRNSQKSGEVWNPESWWPVSPRGCYVRDVLCPSLWKRYYKLKPIRQHLNK